MWDRQWAQVNEAKAEGIRELFKHYMSPDMVSAKIKCACGKTHTREYIYDCLKCHKLCCVDCTTVTAKYPTCMKCAHPKLHNDLDYQIDTAKQLVTMYPRRDAQHHVYVVVLEYLADFIHDHDSPLGVLETGKRTKHQIRASWYTLNEKSGKRSAQFPLIVELIDEMIEAIERYYLQTYLMDDAERGHKNAAACVDSAIGAMEAIKVLTVLRANGISLKTYYEEYMPKQVSRADYAKTYWLQNNKGEA